VEEGIVALLEPFIDTIIVCSMTALVIIVTGSYLDPANLEFIQKNQGGALTSAAMGSVISWFPYLLSIAVFLFAFSTMISWSYYGERCWVWLFGDRSSVIYKGLFLLFTFLGSIITATNILDFSDLMILGMAFPNILGLFLLSNVVKKDLNAYEIITKESQKN
jgi:AGCS family alanine or glycine:cation symporter